VARVQKLKHTLGQPRVPEGAGITLGDAGRLIGHLENHTVAGDDRGNHSVHRGQIGIVPRRHHQHDAERLAANEALKPVLRLDDVVRECARRDVGHVARPFLETSADLEGTLRNGTADLPRQLGADRIGTLDHQVGHLPADRRALRQRYMLPRFLRTDGSLDGRLDLSA